MLTGEPPLDCRRCEVLDFIQAGFLMENGLVVDLYPHQKRVLHYFLTPTPTNEMPFRTAMYSCIKKSGKTEVGSMVMYGWARAYGGLILSVANDQVQARERAFNRLVAMLSRMSRLEPERFEREVVGQPTKDEVTLRCQDGSESVTRAIPCDPYGEAGGMFSLTIWDELWAYRGDKLSTLWSELQPVPAIPGVVRHSIRFVTTYAGWVAESPLLYSLYEQACKPEDGLETAPRVLEGEPVYAIPGQLGVYWDHEPRMPWQTPEFLAAVKADPATLPGEYLRHWENRWTTGKETFVDPRLLDAAIAKGRESGLWNHMGSWDKRKLPLVA